MNRCIAAALATIVVLAGPASAEAQSFPTRPVTLVVPFAAGGNTDIVARIMAEKMGQLLGQPVVVENQGGAGGAIGSSAVARATADGHTILMGTVSTHAIGPQLTRRPPYDPARDFEPISLVATVPLVVVVHPSVPARTLQELAAVIRANPDRLNYGSPGVGTVGHLAGALFDRLTGGRSVHVPYRGTGPALSDLRGGQVQIMFDNVPPMLPHIQAGAINAVGIPGPNRVSVLPDVQSSVEAGFPDFLAYSWNMLFAPARTPAAVLDRLNQAAVEAARDPAVNARFVALSLDVVGSDRAAARRFVETELARWKPVIEASGAVTD
jgi:tripartite-type tricarboxylate transporter receptor subunit TctC